MGKMPESTLYMRSCKQCPYFETKIAVLGLGKVGTLVATLLHESGFEVTGIDTAAKKQKFKTENQSTSRRFNLN